MMHVFDKVEHWNTNSHFFRVVFEVKSYMNSGYGSSTRGISSKASYTYRHSYLGMLCVEHPLYHTP